MTRFTTSILALGIALAAASTAFAQDDVSAVHVRFGDLNLNNPADAAKFENRVDRAVSEICGDRNEIGVGRRVVVEECWARVAPRTRDQVATVISLAHQQQLALASSSPR